MKLILKLIVLIWIFLHSAISAFALNTPVNINATNITSNSLSLSWDNVEDAFGYHVYFSTNPSVEILTAEKREYITEMPLVINDLLPGTQYYFIVNAFDEIGKDESDFSQEVSFVTMWEQAIDNAQNLETEETMEYNSAVDFKLANIEVLAQNQIELSFTSPLENTKTSDRIFKVVDKNDELNDYTISKSEINITNPLKVKVTFNDRLPIDTEFKLTVISILDQEWRNLESGIESFENFIIEEDKLNYVYQEETGNIIIINDDNTTTVVIKDPVTDPSNTWSSTTSEPVIKDPAIIDPVVTGYEDPIVSVGLPSASDNQTWSLLDIVWAGKQAEVLPTTWPTHVLMLIFALVIGAMTFVFKFRK